MRKHRGGSSLVALSCLLLAVACQPASDLPREAVPAEGTEPPPPPPLPTAEPGAAAQPPVAAPADSAVPPPVAAPAETATAGPPAPAPPRNPGCEVAGPAAAAGEQRIRVFFTCADQERPVVRTVPGTRAVLRTALEELLRGPTAEERAAGFQSFFGAATAGALNSVVVDGSGVAHIDFRDFSRAIPNASSSAGSTQLLAQIRATIFQYPTIRSAEITFDRSCEKFWEWLQRGCMTLTRD